MLVATKRWFHGGLICILFSVSEILSEVRFSILHCFWKCFEFFFFFLLRTVADCSVHAFISSRF
jgi:hypothetical protein